MKRKLVYLVVPLQVIILLLIPRFGWYIHHPNAMILKYSSTYREDGYMHSLYSSDSGSIDIAYKNRFSRDLYISIDGRELQHIRVLLDGQSVEGNPNTLSLTGSDIVWKDSSGIFYRIYAFSLGLTLICIMLYYYANRMTQHTKLVLQVLPSMLLCVSLLISLRVII